MEELTRRLDRLREAADPRAAAAIEELIRDGAEDQLNRVNALEFSEARGLAPDPVIGAFLHASRLGLFDMSWNLLCPGCGGVLDASTTLKDVQQREYACSLCAAGYEPTLDEMVEVSFTVKPEVRRIAAHDPDSLTFLEYQRQVFLGSGIRLPARPEFEALLGEFIVDSFELGPGEQAVRKVEFPAQFMILFDAVSHSARFFDVKGEPTRETRKVAFDLKEEHEAVSTLELAPGPVEVKVSNRTRRRALPGLFIAGDTMHGVLGDRKPFLTAKRLLNNKTFREIYRTDTLAVDQRLKITSQTILFTDLKDSTALYDRVGDLTAFDLVRSHFRLIEEAASAESGSIVKTIGDAVMATFPTPEHGMSAGLRMRDAMRQLGDHGPVTLKIGLHEGPCLAVMLNNQLDYFGQTVNVAARVQALATCESIFATDKVVGHAGVQRLIAERGLRPEPQSHRLKGVSESWKVFEIP